MSEVNASRGGVNLRRNTHPTPTLASFASTLPLQGRVAPSAGKARVGRARAAAFDAAQIDFDPRSETLDEDYAAFHIVKKSLPHAEAKAIEDRFQAAFVKVREEHRRWVNNYFHFWIACEDPACKRKEGCAGDPYACHQRWWPWTPERYKVRYRAYVKARAEGGTHEQAWAHAEAELERLADHIAWVEAEQDARFAALAAAERTQGEDAAVPPAPREDAAMPSQPPPRERRPRVRLL